MNPLTARGFIRRLWFLLLLGLLAGPAHAERYALLIGVSDYEYPAFRNLEGPVYDVEALKTVLIRQWGFRAENISTLVNAQANRDSVLQALRQLHNRSQPGDHLFIYFSGHGTSRQDPNSYLPLPYTSGALVPWDFQPRGTPQEQLQRLIVGRWDLRPLLEALDRGNRKVFVAFDTCFSGQAVRGKSNGLTARYIPLPPSPANAPAAPELGSFGSHAQSQEPYPYRHVFFVSAATEAEQAVDIKTANLACHPTLDGRAHGAFTDALLRILTGALKADTDHDGRLSYRELHQALRGFMDRQPYGQTPYALPIVEQDKDALGLESVLDWNAAPAAGSYQPPGEALRVRVSPELAPLREELRSVAGVVLVQDCPDLILRALDGDIQLITAGGDLLVQQPAGLASQVLQRIRQQAWLRTQFADPNPAQQFNVTLDLSGLRQGGVAFAGEAISFMVSSEREAYILLLNIDPHGTIHVTYPYDESELAPVAARRALQLPGETPGDKIRITPPLGTEYMAVVAFAQLSPEQRELLRRLMGKSIAPDAPPFAELQRLLAGPANQRAQAVLQFVTVQR